MTALRTGTQIGQTSGAVGINYIAHPGGNLYCDLIPGDRFKTLTNPLEGRSQTTVLILVIEYLHRLTAGISFTAWIILVRFHLHHPAVFHQDFQAAILST